MARKPTDKKFHCYKDFFQKPASFNNRDFYKWVKKWGTYLLKYKDEFKYLEDDNWKEIRERVLDELYRREDLNDEFDELMEEFEAVKNSTSQCRIDFQIKLVSFMKRNQFEFDFTGELILEMESDLASLIEKVNEYKTSEAKLKRLKREHKQQIAKLDDDLAAYYERTGIRVILNSLPGKNRLKGN